MKNLVLAYMCALIGYVGEGSFSLIYILTTSLYYDILGPVP